MAYTTDVIWDDDERSPFRSSTHAGDESKDDWFKWYVSHYIFADSSSGSLFRDIVDSNRYKYGYTTPSAPPYYTDPEFMDSTYLSPESHAIKSSSVTVAAVGTNEPLVCFLQTGAPLSRLKTTCYIAPREDVGGGHK